MCQRPNRRPRRGLTVLEVIITTVLIVAVYAIVAAGFGGTSPGAEARAKASLSTVLDVELVELSHVGEYRLDPTALDRHIPNLRVGLEPSTDETIVSVGLNASNGNLGVAVRDTNGACWMASATPHGQIVYAVRDNSPTCVGTAAAILTADPGQPDRGTEPDRPLEL